MQEDSRSQQHRWREEVRNARRPPARHGTERVCHSRPWALELMEAPSESSHRAHFEGVGHLFKFPTHGAVTITVISEGSRLVSVSVNSGDQHGGLMRVMVRGSFNSGDLCEGGSYGLLGGFCVSWCSS